MTLNMNDTDLAVNQSRIDDTRTSLRVTFGVIASLALLGNALVCAVILRSRTMLKNSYNLMILALAFTDMFTGKSIECVKHNTCHKYDSQLFVRIKCSPLYLPK